MSDFNCKYRKEAADMYNNWEMTEKEKEELAKFIVCMAIDNLRSQFGIKLQGYKGIILDQARSYA